MGLLLLTLIISGLALHAWLIIEIQLKELAFVKIDKIANPTKNTFLTNPNIFIYTMLFFFIKHLWISTIWSTSVAS